MLLQIAANAQQFEIATTPTASNLLVRFHSSAWTLATGEFTACNVMPRLTSLANGYGFANRTRARRLPGGRKPKDAVMLLESGRKLTSSVGAAKIVQRATNWGLPAGQVLRTGARHQ